MNEKEYIARDNTVAKIVELINQSGKYTDYECGADDACFIVNHIPAADVRPVKRGTWTLNKDGSGTCSECGRTQHGCWDLDNWDNFCHFCGADMREENYDH